MMFKRFILASILVAAASPAFAHADHGLVSGFSSGFMHPLGGLDHLLAMVSVGLFASLLGGRALWAVPASFLGMMLVGGFLGLTDIEVPAFELGIAASVVTLGGAVALGRQWSVPAAMALVGIFAVFHGYAHGAEIPAGTGAALYSAGFILASAMLHGLGLKFGLATLHQARTGRIAGAAIAASGLLLFVA